MTMMCPKEIRALWIQERRAAHYGHKIDFGGLKMLERIMGLPEKHRFQGG